MHLLKGVFVPYGALDCLFSLPSFSFGHLFSHRRNVSALSLVWAGKVMEPSKWAGLEHMPSVVKRRHAFIFGSFYSVFLSSVLMVACGQCQASCRWQVCGWSTFSSWTIALVFLTWSFIGRPQSIKVPSSVAMPSSQPVSDLGSRVTALGCWMIITGPRILSLLVQGIKDMYF